MAARPGLQSGDVLARRFFSPKLAPAAIIAEALGYSPATIERHAKASGAEYDQYVAAVNDAGPCAAQ